MCCFTKQEGVGLMISRSRGCTERASCAFFNLISIRRGDDVMPLLIKYVMIVFDKAMGIG